MPTKVKELQSVATAKTDDPNCATCRRRPDRRYMDEIWRKSRETALRAGSSSVRIDG